MSNNAPHMKSAHPEEDMRLVLDAVEPIEAVRRRGLLFILSSPSGAGKTTLARMLMSADPSIKMSVSATTRPIREGEVDGKDYHFVAKDEFERMVEKGEMLEHAEVFGNYYGSPRGPVEAALAAGGDVLFDVDWQGAAQIRESMSDDVASVFILPPSVAALESRLRGRAQDNEETVRHRMEKAMAEIAHWNEYDHVLVNDDLGRCAVQLSSVLASERLKKWRRADGLREFVDVIEVSEA